MNHLYSPIRAALSTVALKDIQRLEKLGIYHLGDMIDDSTGCRQWYLPVGSEGIRNDLPTPPTQNINLLWKGQFWVICGTGGEDGIVEIVDIHNNKEVRYHRWETELLGTDKLIRNPSILRGSMEELFPGKRGRDVMSNGRQKMKGYLKEGESSQYRLSSDLLRRSAPHG